MITKNLFFGNDSVEEMLKESVKEINRKTPMEIDQFTRLDSAGSTKASEIKYYYTLVLYSKAEVNGDTMQKYVAPGLIQTVKSSDELKYMRAHDITMSYIYHDKNGEPITEISVTPQLYKTN